MTTNGSRLTYEKAAALKAAGLRRITVSLDSLDDGVFQAMNDVSFPVDRVLQAIDAAAKAGLSPVKINMVVKRGVNEDSVVPMASGSAGRATWYASLNIWMSVTAMAGGWRTW